jgi:hypothetical protein
LGGKLKQAGKKFDFKIKIVRTDLATCEYLLGMSGAFGFDGDPAMYRNSSYISKLWYINNYSGGILAKDKIEDMPESYRRFVRFGNPSEKDMLKNYRKEIVMQKNREPFGHNVFYSRPSSQPSQKDAAKNNSGEAQIDLAEAKYAEIMGDFEGIVSFENFKEYVEDVLYGDENPENGCGDGEFGEVYDDDEEIRDILQLNNVYNSELYKMSKVEYDFNAPGHITLTKDGMYEIKYDESEITGVEGSYARIMFSENSRNIATFHKKKFFSDWFALEAGKRVSTEHFGVDFGAVTAAKTKELVNNINLSGGGMRVVYTTEINGVPSEMVSYSIQAKPERE